MPTLGSNAKPDKVKLGVQVIARAVEILRALEGNDQGLSLGQLSRQLDLPKSTVQRIVAALDAENFVIAASPAARVRLGPALVRIARSIRFQVADIARPYLEELSKNTGEAADLAILDGAKAVFIDHIEGSGRLRAVSAVGLSFPLHCTANGKAMLAMLNEEELARMKRSLTLSANTVHSVRTWPKLEAELESIRTTGFAYDLEEHTIGISAVAAAMLGSEGEIAAISVCAPSIRFAEEEKSLIAALLRCHAAITRAFGNRGSSTVLHPVAPVP
jgi:DNA-binding IclR family transcriptional regulator